MPPAPVLADLSIDEIAALGAADAPPPVADWHPERSGDSDMRIAANGDWYHQGGLIRRPAMVRAFSRLLRREQDGAHVLVTPAEKLSIEVEDAPFVAIEMKSEGEGPQTRLAFRLNNDETLIAGPGHGLQAERRADGPRVYLHVRGGLDALLARPVYYELAEIAIAEGGDPLGVWSGGEFFALEPGA